MNYIWATATHVGHVREKNEDSVYPTGDGSGTGPIVVAVADGMGGHAAGEVASRLAIEAATAAPPTAEITVSERVRAGNKAVIDAVGDDYSLAGMGTTLSLGLLDAGGTLHIGHVGDSRIYLYRYGELTRLTTDHTLVEEMAAHGQIAPEDVDTHPQRHLLTRVLGMAGVSVDDRSMTVIGGDRLVFCSDGLTGMVTETRIAELLGKAETPQDAAWKLVEAANAAGGLDNTTVAVVDVRP